MLDKKFAKYVFAGAMAVMMTFFMSIALTLISVGYGDGFWWIWFKSFFLGIVIAFPTALSVAPIAHRIASMLVRYDDGDF